MVGSGECSEMNRLVATTLLGLLAGWLALFDHCLIVVAGAQVSSEIAFLCVFQASMVAIGMLITTGRLSSFADAASRLSFRMKLFAFGLPLIVLLISPFMISESIYRARYGADKFVIHAHMGRDFECCLNPFSTADAP